jgi:DNA-binding NarL/FixJ family response regulator
MPMRVVIVDDHEAIVNGLTMVLKRQPDFEVVGVAGNAAEGLQRVSETRPDLVILDMNLPGSNGIIVAREILRQLPETRIIIFSGYVTPEYVQEAVQAGVIGYLSKAYKMTEFQAALRAAQQGQLYLCPDAATLLAQDYRKRVSAEPFQLSDRERDILKRVAEGGSTKEIADALKVSVKTVETHRQNIMSKLNLHSIAELTKYAIRQGLTEV